MSIGEEIDHSDIAEGLQSEYPTYDLLLTELELGRPDGHSVLAHHEAVISTFLIASFDYYLQHETGPTDTQRIAELAYVYYRTYGSCRSEGIDAEDLSHMRRSLLSFFGLMSTHEENRIAVQNIYGEQKAVSG